MQLEKILDVPYHSQLLEIDSTVHAVQGCSITCLKMVFDYYKTECSKLSLNELNKKYRNENGFTTDGWSRDAVEKFLVEEKIEVERYDKIDFETGIAKILHSLEESHPVLLSVKRIFCEQEYYHMIVATGFQKNQNGDLVGFYYHEPYATSIEKGKNKFLKIISDKGEFNDFKNYWRNMLISVKM